VVKKNVSLPGAHGKRPQKGWTFLLCLLILFLVAVAATRSVWAPALLAGHSARKDLARLVEFDAAIRAGDFFPTWSPDLYSGYGSPIFQFYAPLAYYATELPVLMGFDHATALKLTQLLALFASGLAMYRLASTYFSGWIACLGGVFYMVAPYRLVDMFVRHALAEQCAFIWLPLIVWGTERFASKSRGIAFATGALATAALILTHNVMALIGLPVCVVAGCALALPKRGTLSPKSFAVAASVAALGIGLAAFFWWPAISGLPFTHAEPSLTGGYYDFHRHFVEGWQFLDPRWSFGISGGDTDNRIPLQIGPPHLLTGLGSLVMLLSRWQGGGDAGRRRALWSVVGLCVMAVGMFMCCRWSQPLWEWLPLVRYAQFPWRFLGLVVFGSAICATALADRFGAVSERAAIIASLVGLVVIMVAYFPYYSQAYFFAGDARTQSWVKVSATEVNALRSAGALVPFDLTTDDLRRTHERGTSGDDYLPRDVKEKPTQPPVETVHAESGGILESVRLRQNHYRSHLQMSAPGKADLLQYWFPGWQAKVDGLPVPTAPVGPNAIVSCDVPGGDHVVEFSYGALPQRKTGIIISIVSAAIGASVLWFLRSRYRKPA
jgi:hypothetical protein